MFQKFDLWKTSIYVLDKFLDNNDIITELKRDGELYMETGKLEIHKSEPFGPFGLTEWIKNTNYTSFPQQSLLDSNGQYGIHSQNSSWKAK